MNTIKKILLAIRPWSFPASIMPVLIGTAYVFFLQHLLFLSIHWWLLPFILVSVVAFHAAGNIFSDYHDAQNGIDKLESYGDTNLLLNGMFTKRKFLIMGLGWLSLAIICGFILLIFSNWKLLFFGIFGIISALFYYRLKYRGLGDIIILFSFGLCIVSGTVFALSHILDIQSICLSIPVSLLTVAILHANNTRDMPLDRVAGIRTLSMVIGLKGAKNYYYILLLAPYFFQFWMIYVEYLPPWCALIILSFPFALKNINALKKVDSNSLENIAHLDVNTAQLTTLFSLLSIIGLVIASL